MTQETTSQKNHNNLMQKTHLVHKLSEYNDYPKTIVSATVDFMVFAGLSIYDEAYVMTWCERFQSGTPFRHMDSRVLECYINWVKRGL